MADKEKPETEELEAKEPEQKVEQETAKEEEPKVESKEEPKDEPQKSDEIEEKEEEDKTPEEEEGEEVPPQMSRRKAKRLEKLEGLVERLKKEETPTKKPEGINYRDMIQADDEVYSQLETKSQEYGQTQYNAGLEQAKSIQFHTRLEIDAPKVESRYPIFDKESPEFNPVVANSINQWYLASVGYDPKTDTVANGKVRYSEFVEGIMELADNMAGQKSVKTTQNIAKQAATTGLRPDGSSAKRLDLTKAPEQMTDDELKAVISQSIKK